MPAGQTPRLRTPPRRFTRLQRCSSRSGAVPRLQPPAGRPALQTNALPHPLTDALETLAQQVGASVGFRVQAVQVLTNRIPMTVQIFVQRADGTDVNLDECAAFSAPLGEAIDAVELLTMPYVLEVSSPGIGEELCSDRDFTSFRGFPVEVVSRDAAKAREGLLLGRDEQAVLLNMRGRTVRIPRDQVLGVRLVNPGGSA
jgi:ribosome maturation factor RimP